MVAQKNVDENSLEWSTKSGTKRSIRLGIIGPLKG